MGYDILWFIPTAGDEHYLASPIGRRPASYDYIRQIAAGIDYLGYYGVLLPTGPGCEDAWITAASLIPETKRLRFLVAVRPGITLPAASARMAATFDRLSQGRLIVNVVTGGGQRAMAADGVFLDEARRYEVTDEFLEIWRRLLRDGKADFEGDHLRIEGGVAPLVPVQRPYPPIWFGGSSDKGIRVGAKHADVYLTWGEPRAMVREKLDRVREQAAQQGRSVRFGIRLQVVVRETEAQAWEAANDLLRYLTDETIGKFQSWLAGDGSVGQDRMRSLHGGKRDALEVSPNLWAGIGLARPGVGTALVGTPEIVAERMHEYAALGIDTFIMSGYPHLEEAYRFAELVFPHLPLNHPSPYAERLDPAAANSIVSARFRSEPSPSPS
jgi:alkanesulfonate monooxygenase